MLVSAVMFSAMHTMVRHVGQDLHPFEVAFFRNIFGLAVMLPLLIRVGWNGLRTRHPYMLLTRCVLGGFAMLTWFYGLSVVPVAEATALSFTNVIFASIGAALFLGERMRLSRWMAVGFGFLGAMIILRPGLQSVSNGMWLVLLSSFAWGMAVVMVKYLSRTDSVVSIVAWMVIVLTVLSLIPALLVWTWPTLPQIGWLVIIGALATSAHLAMVKALKLADASALLPLDFTRLIWAALFGYIAFAESPDHWTWVGGAVIIASATYLIVREARARTTEVSSR
jgi:drug/metabolite transporter (DMT)-like permease